MSVLASDVLVLLRHSDAAGLFYAAYSHSVYAFLLMLLLAGVALAAAIRLISLFCPCLRSLFCSWKLPCWAAAKRTYQRLCVAKAAEVQK